MKRFSETIVLLLVCGVVNAVTDEVMTVMEGDSVTLDTGVTELKEDGDSIRWKFVEGDSKPLIVKVFKNKIEYKDKRFKDRLQTQHGSITIKNIKNKFAGSYEAEIQNGTETIKNFSVVVKESQHVSADGTYKVKSMSVMEGETVTLNTDDKLQNDTLILWRFGDEGRLIAKDDKEDNKSSIYAYDERFRDRLKLDDQTGSLIITKTKTTDAGLYQLKISSNKQQTYKKFSVSIKDNSKSLVLGICFALAAVAVAAGLGVLHHRRNSQVPKPIVKLEGDDVLLESGQSDAVMEWIFGDDVIARLNKKISDFSTYDGADERFRDRLDLNEQTGDLTIKNIKTRHSGLYKLRISTSTRVSSTFQFNVIVKAKIISEPLGSHVTLNIEENQENDEMLWMFGASDTRIARFSEGKPLFFNYLDERFDNNLEINKKTGSLTIINLTPKNTGAYQVQILRSGETEYKKFYVTVRVSAKVGESVTLCPNEEIKNKHCVKWIFDNKIDVVTGKNGADSETKYTDDKRFRGRLEINPETGDLTITDIRKTDEGIYKLQHTVISDRSEKKISCRKFTVEVLPPGEDPNSVVMMPLLNP